MQLNSTVTFSVTNYLRSSQWSEYAVLLYINNTPDMQSNSSTAYLNLCLHACYMVCTFVLIYIIISINKVCLFTSIHAYCRYGGSGDSSIDSGVVSRAESNLHCHPRETDIDNTFKYLHI